MDSDRSPGFEITADPDTTRVDPAVATASPDIARATIRLALVADLYPHDPPPNYHEGDHRRCLDGPDIGAWMAKQPPTLAASVENHLDDDMPRLVVELPVPSLKTLSPDGLTDAVPALRRVRALRDAIAEARAGRLDRDALRDRLAKAMPPEAADTLIDALRPGGSPPTASGNDALDRLLTLVDGAAAPPPSRTDSALDALVGAAVGAGEPVVDRAAADRLTADLDRRLAAQLDALLNAPETRRLEAAWRGLAFLARRAAFRDGLHLDVLPASRKTLAEALHFQLLLPEHAGDGSEPLAAIVIDQAFGRTTPEIEALTDLASTGASLQVPVIATADAAFFGFEKPTDLVRLGPLRQHFATEPYLGFRKLRASDEAQFLALALPGFALREPHALPGAATESGVLWGGGALLAAAAMLERHRATGRPIPSAGAAVGDLVVRKTRVGGLPLAASFADRVLMDLAAHGFFAFQGPLNRDLAVAGHPAVVRAPESEDGGRSTLAAAVFTALAAQRLLAEQERLAGHDPETVETTLAHAMRRFLGLNRDDGDEPAVTVQYLDEHDTEESRTFGVRLWPPRNVLALPVGLVLGATVPREPHRPDSA